MVMHPIDWMDLYEAWILPPEGTLVKCLPEDKRSVIKAYVCNGRWYNLEHKELKNIRWWKTDPSLHRDGSVTSLQYPRAWAYIQEVINRY